MTTKINLSERTRGQWWQSTEPMVQVSYSKVRDLGLAALKQAGASEEDAAFLLSSPLSKSVQGDHTRGLEGLPQTVKSGAHGALRASIKILRETESTALVDDDPAVNRSLVCRDAMNLAIAKARKTGVSWVSVRFPASILTAHLQQAIDANMVGMVMTQSYSQVAAYGGFRPLLSNAPVGFGVPAGRHDGVIFDASLTQTSASGVKMAAREGQSIPEGFILDEKGDPTTDPKDFPASGHYTHENNQSRGTLLPLGGSHKGYSLVFIVSLLTTVLTNTQAPWEAGRIEGGTPVDPSERYGSTFMAIDPAAFMPIDEFLGRVDSYIDAVKASPLREGASEILYPGERSQQLRRERQEADVFLLPTSHWKGLEGMASELGLTEFLPLNTR